MVKRDYYEVLGLPSDADEESIKDAFQALARDWHPDVADVPDAEERFRELAEAYSVLSKREARLLYDRYGYRGRGHPGFDQTLLEAMPLQVEAKAKPPVAPEPRPQVVEPRPPVVEARPSAVEEARPPVVEAGPPVVEARPPVVERGENVYVDVELRSFEAADGTRRTVTYDAVVRCKACMGRGSLGLPDPECEYCGGTGQKRTVSPLDADNLFQLEPCPACVGEACSRCGGTGTVFGQRRIRLRIPAGVEHGAQLRVSGDGNDAGAGSIPGDLLVRVHVQPPPRDPRLVRYAAFVLLLIAIGTLVLYVLR